VVLVIKFLDERDVLPLQRIDVRDTATDKAIGVD
jgi:hypothetical protein